MTRIKLAALAALWVALMAAPTLWLAASWPL